MQIFIKDDQNNKQTPGSACGALKLFSITISMGKTEPILLFQFLTSQIQYYRKRECIFDYIDIKIHLKSHKYKIPSIAVDIGNKHTLKLVFLFDNV